MSPTNRLDDQVVTVFGGSGFIGNYLVQCMLEGGARVRIASRNPEKSFSLKPLADLGQLQLQRCDITNQQSLQAAIQGSTQVVNLVGAFGKNQMRLMGDAPGVMAQIAIDAGVKALVHLSGLGSDENSPAEYARAKHAGEVKVKEAFPKATILRPSVVYGMDDKFLNMFGKLISMAPVLPVFGPEAKMELVYVNDVARAIFETLKRPAVHGGKTYELGGPEAISMLELHQRIANAQGRSTHFIRMPDWASSIFAALPGTPMNSDQWALLKQGSMVSGKHPGFKKLGIEPKPLSLFLEKWMVQYRQFGRFGKSNERAMG
ncbi:MAG: complex I NDUFA9 subunit family protein [Erythrobacter sp.]